jgi:hypothetical protein
MLLLFFSLAVLVSTHSMSHMIEHIGEVCRIDFVHFVGCHRGLTLLIRSLLTKSVMVQSECNTTTAASPISTSKSSPRNTMVVVGAEMLSRDTLRHISSVVAVVVRIAPGINVDTNEIVERGFIKVGTVRSRVSVDSMFFTGSKTFCRVSIPAAVTILSTDTRLQTNRFVRATAAINSAYARRHGYKFIFRTISHDDGSTAWCKLQFLSDTVRSITTPTYVIAVDSDAHFTSFETSLPAWLESNAIDMPVASYSVLVSTESAVPGLFSFTHALNTGVLYVFVDPSDKDRHTRLTKTLQIWRNAAHTPLCISFLRHWPYEQGCLEKLLATSELVRSVVQVAPGHMNIWNGPWGRYIRHMWSGVGKELRPVFVNDTIARYLVNETEEIHNLRIDEGGCNV